MKILLDTSFILSCAKEKADFLEAENYGDLLLPEEVIEELENLAKKAEKRKDRDASCLALDIISKNGKKFNFIKLEDSYVDSGIIKFAEKNKDIIVATIDKQLKKELKGKAKILSLRAGKKLFLS